MIRYGVLQPPAIVPTARAERAAVAYRVVWGNRRVAAARQAGLDSVPVVRLKRPVAETEFLLLQVAENEVRAALTDPEVYLAVKAVQRLNPAWTRADVAARFGKDPSMLTRVLAVDDLIPAAREAFLAGGLRFSIAYEIAKGGSEKEQHRLLAERLGGSTRAEMARAPRPARRAAGDGVTAGRLRIALGDGVTVTVAGGGLTLGAAALALDRAGKEAEKARAQGLNVRTAERVWKDRAKAKAAGPATG